MILSIDIGTTVIKFSLFDLYGKEIYSLRKNTPFIKEELNTINIEEIYNSVIIGIKDVKEQYEEAKIDVIGISGQMGGIVGINKEWKALFNFDPPVNNNFKKYLQNSLAQFGDIITSTSGSIPVNSAKIIYWKNEREEVYKKIKKVITLSSYITGKLINLDYKEAFIDRTSLYLFGISDKQVWSDSLCEMLSIPNNILPKIKKSTEIVGKLCIDVAKKTNLKSGIPIIAGCGDTAASFLGAGIINEGEAIDSAGTCSIFGICSKNVYADKKNKTLLRMEAPIPNLYYLVGINFGGKIHEWFENNLFTSNIQKKNNKLSQFLQYAKKITPGSDNLIFLPFIGGSFIPPNDILKGTCFGLDWNHNLYHLYRSFLESIAFEYLNYLKIYKSLSNKKIENVIVIGGSSNNELWNQIKADVLGVNYNKLANKNYESIGTALVAGVGVGIFKDLKKVLKKNRNISKIFNHSNTSYEKYKKIYEKYKILREKYLEAIYEDINKY